MLKGLSHATVLYCTVLWVSFEMMVYSIRVLLRTRYQVAVATEVSRRLFVFQAEKVPEPTVGKPLSRKVSCFVVTP